MERDKNFSDQTPSREQKPVPQSGERSQGAEPSASADDTREVAEDTKDAMKVSSGKLPRGDV